MISVLHHTSILTFWMTHKAKGFGMCGLLEIIILAWGCAEGAEQASCGKMGCFLESLFLLCPLMVFKFQVF